MWCDVLSGVELLLLENDCVSSPDCGGKRGPGMSASSQ